MAHVQRTFEIWAFVFTFVFKRVALNLKFTYWGKYSEAARKVMPPPRTSAADPLCPAYHAEPISLTLTYRACRRRDARWSDGLIVSGHQLP